MATPPKNLNLNTVRRGDEDKQAFLLQIHLKHLGYYTTKPDGTELKIDGDIASYSGIALRAFETDHGLTVDAEGKEGAGREVWTKLQELLGDDFWWTPSSVGEPAPPTNPLVDHDSMKMGVVNLSRNFLNSEAQRWIDVHQRVIDNYYRHDWGHVTLRLAPSVDALDTFEVQHDLTDGLDIDNAAGYHTWRVVNIGGRSFVMPYARTDVTVRDADETFGHEVFETEGNAGTNVLAEEIGEPDLERMYENCDITQGAPHDFMGLKVACWVKRATISGLNATDPSRLDSGHWFGEGPRLRSVKSRTDRGFQIYRRRTTGQFFFEFGDYPPGVPFSSVQDGESVFVQKPLAERVRPMSEALDAGLPFHVVKRCERYAATRAMSA